MKACMVGYGRMGQLIASMLNDSLAGVVSIDSENKSLFDTKFDFDVIIDFSNPANLDMILDYAILNKKAVVMGTTGYTDEQLEKIKRASKQIPILRSANYSLGVILLNRLVKEITPILKDTFDIEIIEAHHHSKIDAPSGTAKMLLDSAVEKTGFTPVYGRNGYSPRQTNEIGVHALRGGSICGEHEVLYCGDDEIIKLTHSASSRKIFATGAIKAANWLSNQKPGYYDMEDVLFGKGE